MLKRPRRRSVPAFPGWAITNLEEVTDVDPLPHASHPTATSSQVDSQVKTAAAAPAAVPATAPRR